MSEFVRYNCGKFTFTESLCCLLEAMEWLLVRVRLVRVATGTTECEHFCDLNSYAMQLVIDVGGFRNCLFASHAFRV